MAGWTSNEFINIDQNTGFIINNNCSNNNTEVVVRLTENDEMTTHEFFYNIEDCRCGDDSLLVTYTGRYCHLAFKTDNLRLKSIEDCDVVAMRGNTGATKFQTNEEFDFQYPGYHDVLYKTFDYTIDESGFTGCDKILNVYIGENFATIPEAAFSGCVSLSGVCAPGVKTVNASAFTYDSALEKFYFNDKRDNITVGDYAFAYCTGLKVFTRKSDCDCSHPTSSESGVCLGCVSSFGKYAFYNCQNLSGDNFYISASLDEYSIAGTSIEELKIGTQAIHITSFNNCTQLTKVRFGDETKAYATTINGTSGVLFGGCTRITDVYILSNVKMEIPNGCSAFEQNQTVTVHVKSALLDRYTDDDKWNVSSNVTFVTTFD